jgi:peptide-methionine (S)-S-oxide reductase
MPTSHTRIPILLLALACFAGACGQRTETGETQGAPETASIAPPTEDPVTASEPSSSEPRPTEALATFGGGCFWCTEAVFQELAGVVAVESGYSGGGREAPTYDEVCSGLTGFAEAVQVRYDPSQVSYAQILEVFFKTHDPTTLNRQGADFGTQYRSVIFTHDAAQRETAEKIKRSLDASGAYFAPIVTEIADFDAWFPAEDYHQDYFASNPGAGYCRAVIQPKLEKFRKVFADRLKKRE